MPVEEVKRRWNESAASYAARYGKDEDINKTVLLTPALLEMLGDMNGKRVLDAGCGEGYLSRLIARRGASVTAMDYSENLLQIARERTPGDLDITYIHGNFQNMAAVQNGSFEIVVSVAVIQDIPDHQAAISEAYRVLAPEGLFLMALLHPCFSADGGWIRNERGEKLYWKIDNYFYEQASEQHFFQTTEGNNPLYFHRTLTNYFRTVVEAGFMVEDILEPVPSEAALEKHPEFKDDFRMCHYLIFQLRK